MIFSALEGLLLSYLLEPFPSREGQLDPVETGVPGKNSNHHQ